MVDRPTLDLPAEDERLARLLIGFAEGDLNEAEMLEWDTALAGSEALQELLIATCLQRQLLPQVLADMANETPAVLPTIPPTSPALGFLGNVTHGAFTYFSEGWPLAYLLSTIIFVVGLGIFSLMTVRHHTQIAEQLSTPFTRSIVSEKPSYIGRVTGMVDIKWADASTAAVTDLVSLGRKYALASGLMEITYDTGAKVILQGPVTYEVDSRDGGFLSIGKLTARLEKKRSEVRGQGAEKVVSGQQLVASGQRSVASKEESGGRVQNTAVANQKSEIRNQKSLAPSPQPLAPDANPQSPISNPSPSPAPAFAVRTPSAVVTDLGTEFGVDVSTSGAMSVHVFHGVIELQPSAYGNQPCQPIRLVANEAAAAGPKMAVRRMKADAALFVRAEQLPQLAEKSRRIQASKHFLRWQAFSQKLRRDPSLLAYYDFQKRPADLSRLVNVAENGRGARDGVITKALWTTGRMPGKDALRFHGPEDHVAIKLPQQVRDLTLFAWVYVMSLDNPGNALLMSEGWDRTGEVHWQLPQEGTMCFDICHVKAAWATHFFDQWSLSRWTHLAVVCNRASASIKLFRNGGVMGETTFSATDAICIDSAWIGLWNAGSFDPSSNNRCRNFHGLMDELAIYGRPLSEDEIYEAFAAGTPPSGDHLQQGGK